ncbi:Rossmann-fold NAD(P)-binding domain-containing protein [Enemella evansiae]|uniref:Uncharacterized protein n=1 Tax=Enemella evansiae TaxID=2016499 RepID=A0A255GBC4_9ACTN|nr:hypothetical protein [Enemella evansiae]PFG66107.1 hypothetical protein B0O41_0886 [Propionibacteriaceae bacterium ES.041]OYO00247.1 hypothetical protein CGZ97_19685 [Enemella evansiae]OYO04726.1 hypothetical protein CGZ96_00875 [Enemella evansiae]OYO04886.1 hypothetical protein CGZ95_03170 [Enemella evansiae]OYO07715.1 hypothetical protein BI335_20315 [Enemella evansiae]
MTETFSVPEMRTHHSNLQAVDSSTQDVVGRAQDTGIGDWKMYGIFASPIVCPILMLGDQLHGRTIDELGRVSATVTEGFGTTADLYDATEQSNVDLAKSITAELASMREATGR